MKKILANSQRTRDRVESGASDGRAQREEHDGGERRYEDHVGVFAQEKSAKGMPSIRHGTRRRFRIRPRDVERGAVVPPRRDEVHQEMGASGSQFQERKLIPCARNSLVAGRRRLSVRLRLCETSSTHTSRSPSRFRTRRSGRPSAWRR